MSEIKNCFTSRFDGGKLFQFDYSQLEVVCLAFLSGDEMLKKDLREGLDMHCRSASFFTGRPYKEIKAEYDDGSKEIIKIRTFAKQLGFLVQYGGAAGLMHKKTGLPLKDCKFFIASYYDRYYGVKLWQQMIETDVLRNRVAAKHKVGEEDKQPPATSTIDSPTRRRYTFVEQPAPEYTGKKMSFSPTQMKNHPVQGFATGDVVPMMLGRLNRMIQKSYPKGALMVNTTHDSVMFDVSTTEVHWAVFVADVVALLESAPSVINEVFKIDFDMQLKIDVEFGNTWGNLIPWKLTSGRA